MKSLPGSKLGLDFYDLPISLSNGRSPAPPSTESRINAPDVAPLDTTSPAMHFDADSQPYMTADGDAGLSETARPDWADVQSLLPTADIPHVEGCACSSCSFKEETLTRVDNGSAVGSSENSAAPALLGDMAEFLLTGYWNTGYGDGTRTHNLTSSGIDPNNGVLHFNLSGYSADANGVTADRAFLIREAFKLFEATLGIQFVETTSTDANLVDFFFRDNASGAYASHSYYNSGTWGSSIHYAQINVATSWSGGTSTYDDYTLQTILHELGHALGLGHQGTYNGSASYGVDNTFENDSWQASMMSYFSQSENSTINASYEFLQTPMAVDWMALDEIYGRQGFGVSNAFTGDTVYGFNTNITSAVSDIWASFSSYANRTASTIVDGAGIDTLDLSGYANNTVINLASSVPGATTPSISSIGGRIGNLTIAAGTIIENAIGGDGGETFYGNAADNTLTGNGGDDIFFDSAGADTYLGGLGSDSVTFAGDFFSYSFELAGSFLRVIDIAIDLVESTVEWLTFSDQTLSFSEVVNGLTTNVPPVANDDSYAVSEDSVLSVTDLLANDTDPDEDPLTVTAVNSTAVDPGAGGTQITLSSGAFLTVYADGGFDYDPNGAFDWLKANETGADSFTYTASDGNGGQDTATVLLTINGVAAEDSDDPNAPALPSDIPEPEIVLDVGRGSSAMPGDPVPSDEPNPVGDIGEDTGDDPEAPLLPPDTPEPELVLDAGRDPGAITGEAVPSDEPGRRGDTGEIAGNDPDAIVIVSEDANYSDGGVILAMNGRDTDGPMITDGQDPGRYPGKAPGAPDVPEDRDPAGDIGEDIGEDSKPPITDPGMNSTNANCPSLDREGLHALRSLADTFVFDDIPQQEESETQTRADDADRLQAPELLFAYVDRLFEEFKANWANYGIYGSISGVDRGMDGRVEFLSYANTPLGSLDQPLADSDYLGP